MTEQKIIYQGAEAKIIKSQFMGYDVIQKERIQKNYRIQQINERLISFRTREESKLLAASRHAGVSVPIIFDVDLTHGIITMEFLKGKRIKDIFNHLSDDERRVICQQIGKSIAKLHNNDIIHGDITTSNMILCENHIHFIDFGLGEKNGEIEAKGVDLHVLMEAIESTHSLFSSSFDDVLEGYRKELKTDAHLIIKKIQEIVKRGRYR